MKLLKNLIAVAFCLAAGGAYAAPKTVVVVPFDVVGNAVTAEEVEALTELYSSSLADTGKVNVADRTNLDKLMAEMKFQSSDWSTPEKTAKLGQAANAQIISRGKIMKLGSTYYLSASFIDIKTAVVIASAKIKGEYISGFINNFNDFSQELVDNITWHKGGKGPGGGTIFYIEGNKALEFSEILGSGNFEEAYRGCRDYSGGGYNNWYLPTLQELELIFPHVCRQEGYYWSSTEYDSIQAKGRSYNSLHR
ncbi:MAG: CsgG/HfaB family protein [Treponema sp.]